MSADRTSKNHRLPVVCVNGCNAPFGIRCSVCNSDKVLPNADSALDFLVQASRVDRFLRSQVQVVEDEIGRLRRERTLLTAAVALAIQFADKMDPDATDPLWSKLCDLLDESARYERSQAARRASTT